MGAGKTSPFLYGNLSKSLLNGKLNMKIANMQSRLAHSPAMAGRPLARRGCLSSQKCLSHRHIRSAKPGVPRRLQERKYSLVISNQASQNGEVRSVMRTFDHAMTDAARPNPHLYSCMRVIVI